MMNPALFLTIMCWWCQICGARDNNTDGYVLRTYDELGLLRPNGSVAVDAINLLRCFFYRGMPCELLVGVTENGFLKIIVDNLRFNRTFVDCIARSCIGVFGKGITLLIDYRIHEEDNLQLLGTLGQVSTSDTVDPLNNLVRSKRIE